jgi:hypothetical protein
MSYGDNPVEDSLYYGDLLVDFFDEENNMVNPPSDVGFFLYNLFGKAFDDAHDIINAILLNLDPVTCELPFLNIISQGVKVKRKVGWSDAKWRAVVISYYYNLETIAGIEFVLNIINKYYNQSDSETELEDITVEGYSLSFTLSDKHDTFNRCSDKNTKLDGVGSMYEQSFYVDMQNNPPNEIITELLTIIENGGP